MRSTMFAVVLTAVLMVSTGAFAQTKVGVLDGALVLSSSEASKRANATLKKNTKEAQDKIRALEKPLLEERNKLIEQRDVLAKEEFAKKEQAWREKMAESQKKAEDIQANVNREIVRLRREVATAIQESAAAVAKEKGLDIVVSKEATLYVNDTLDITDEVLKRVNDKLK